MTRCFFQAWFVALLGVTFLSACGLGTGGLANDVRDAAMPDGSMDPGFADASGTSPGPTSDTNADDTPPSTTDATGNSESSLATGADATVDAADETSPAADANGRLFDAADGTPSSATEAASDATASLDEGGADASSDRTVTNGTDAATDGSGGNPSDGSNSDAGVCVLAAGGTLCCGAMTCTNHGGSCAAPGFCNQCAIMCTDPTKPICCALAGQVTTCEKRPIDC